MKTKNKVLVSGTIDPEVFESLTRYCQAHPNRSRSQVMSLALSQFFSPEQQDQRQRVVAQNLDRLYWHVHNHSKRMSQELRVIREMLALFVRTFYNHMPDVPEEHREAAAADGQLRFAHFLEILAEHAGSGPSALELMPEPAVAAPEKGTDADELLPESSELETGGKKEESDDHGK